MNSLVACLFARKVYDVKTICEALDSVGIEWSTEQIKEFSHRLHGLKFLFKEKCGFTFDKLALPEKLTRVYMSNGKIDQVMFKRGLELYRGYVESDKEMARSEMP